MSKLVEIDQCQKTFLISTLVDIPFGSIIRKSKDLFNFYSCRLDGLFDSLNRQKAFLISTLVDFLGTSMSTKVKRPF